MTEGKMRHRFSTLLRTVCYSPLAIYRNIGLLCGVEVAVVASLGVVMVLKKSVHKKSHCTGHA